MATNSGGWLYEANGTPVDKATADNAQARVLEIKQSADTASTDAAMALQTANAYAGQIAQANTTAGSAVAIAQGAEDTADNAASRVDALEVMGGVQPGGVNDAEMKLHAEQEGGLFNTELKAQMLQGVEAAGDIRDALDFRVAALMAMGPGVLAVEHGVTATPLGSADQNRWGEESTPALNALIASVSASGGGHIILPPGEIRLDAHVVPKSNVLLTGSGIGATVLHPQQYGFLHTSGNPSDVLYNFHQRDMTVDGRRAPGATWKGWHGQYHQKCSWQDVEYKTFGMTGLGPDYLRECSFYNVHIYDTGRNNDGTQPSGNGIGFAVGGSWLDGSTEETFVVMSCHVDKVANFGIMWEGGSPNVAGQAYGGAIVIGNTVKNSRGGINASGGRNAIIQGNYTYNNVEDGIWIGLGTLPNSAPGWRALVTGNQSHSNGRHGIAYDEVLHAKLGDTIKITNNVTSGNGVDGVNITTGGSDLAGVDVSGNLCHSNTQAGIRVKSTGGRKIFALKVDDNVLASNYSASGGVNYAQIAQVMLEGVDIQGGSVSDNVFHGTGVDQRQCIALGTTAAPAKLTGVKVAGNVPPASGNVATIQHAYATMTASEIRGNLGYPTGIPAAVTVGASPFTYTAGPVPENVYVRSGTVTAIRKAGVAVFVNTDNMVALDPNQSVTIEYSAIPILYRERRQ